MTDMAEAGPLAANQGQVAAGIPTIPFGSKRIGPGLPVVVIAEIGINHEGDAETCARMINSAAEAKADAVKLQTIDADENYVRGTESHTLFSRFGLTREETARAFTLARELGMEAFTTAGDFTTFDWVDRLAPAAHKISSGLLTNHPIIRHAAKTGRPLLMSTGMAEAADVDAAVEAARAAAAIGLFQCTSLYPAPLDALNLASIGWLRNRHCVPVGFSDHSMGIEVAPLSVAAGACMIEKHFTLDSSRAGCDHQLSLEPRRFAEMVDLIRRAEIIVGVGEKRMTAAERENAGRYRRIVVARRDVATGELFDSHNIALKRPHPGVHGLAPHYYEHILGRTARRSLKADDPVVADTVGGDL
jgi:N-acetylneuraminate synthase/N,N'-diacetyllegionaminate synthase